MSRQLEQKLEERNKRLRAEVTNAVYGGLEAAVQDGGGELKGFSVKLSGGDCLITLRAEFTEGSQIAFVGSADFPDAMRKAVRELRGDMLSWRNDRYA